MEKRVEELFDALEERLNFFSQIGAEFMFSSSSSKNSVYNSLRERIIHCQKCPLSQGRTNAVPGEGSVEAELMFVGEAPGRDEDIQGKPFVGRAGQLLTKIINAMEFKGRMSTSPMSSNAGRRRTELPTKKRLRNARIISLSN